VNVRIQIKENEMKKAKNSEEEKNNKK